MRKFKVEIDTDECIGELLRQATEGRPTTQDRMVVCRTLHLAGLANMAALECYDNRLVCLYGATDVLRQTLSDKDIVASSDEEKGMKTRISP